MNGEKQIAGKLQTADLARIALGAVVIIICSWISIPTAIPFTMQTFAVFLILGILGGKKGTLSIVIYILLGAIGIPVFAGFTGGIGIILGTTGGYILGFIFMGLLYWLFESLFGKKLSVTIISMIIGLFVCYAFGTAWFIFVYAGQSGAIGIGTALAWCVVPFIVPDVIKMVLAIVISSRIRKYIKQ